MIAAGCRMKGSGGMIGQPDVTSEDFTRTAAHAAVTSVAERRLPELSSLR
jgi:hypothetical protein